MELVAKLADAQVRGWLVPALRDTNSAQKKRGGSGFVQFVSGSALSGHALPARFFRPACAQLRPPPPLGSGAPGALPRARLAPRHSTRPGERALRLP